jgi:hypothetical protein
MCTLSVADFAGHRLCDDAFSQIRGVMNDLGVKAALK